VAIDIPYDSIKNLKVPWGEFTIRKLGRQLK